MDAFAHCLEAYCSPFFHPMSQGIALEGMRLVIENLPRAYDDGSDIEARGNMMSAAATKLSCPPQSPLNHLPALAGKVPVSVTEFPVPSEKFPDPLLREFWHFLLI